jgi:3-hydroxyisobutyrate dehydrogenase
MRIGFIGLGSMGAPIARRLARCGFDVTGCDISPQILEAFDGPSTSRSADPIATAHGMDMLGICVRTDQQLEELAGLAAKAKGYGVGFVDVGVSGGGPAASEGKLSLFVGGENVDVTRARPWLEAIGSSVAHLGPVGKGQEAKLLNNLISIANYGMSAAIIDVAESLGFDRRQIIDALMAGSAQSFALKVAPGFVRPRAAMGAPGSFMGLHDLLKKDVDHASKLPTAEKGAMAALLASCEAMLARIRRAAAEYRETEA